MSLLPFPMMGYVTSIVPLDCWIQITTEIAQERHAIRQALRQPNSVSAHRSMLKRLEELEKLITESNKRRTK